MKAIDHFVMAITSADANVRHNCHRPVNSTTRVYEMKKLLAAIALLCLSTSVLAHDIYSNLRDRASAAYSSAEWQLLSADD